MLFIFSTFPNTSPTSVSTISSTVVGAEDFWQFKSCDFHLFLCMTVLASKKKSHNIFQNWTFLDVRQLSAVLRKDVRKYIDPMHAVVKIPKFSKKIYKVALGNRWTVMKNIFFASIS